MPGKLNIFWQELKRRKVIRVITVYAAAAFVILELVSMSEEPFGLPDWTYVLAVILLSIGFLIAIILSWIYDIHDEPEFQQISRDVEAEYQAEHERVRQWLEENEML